MKKLFVLFLSGVLSLTATAQEASLVGTWQQLDSNGFPTTSVKVFMPDGKLLGQSFNEDFTVSSVWFMSNYKMLNDSSYIDHAFYHSSPYYQRDYYFTFYMENDSVLVSKYIDYRNNGFGTVVQERWKKMNRPMLVFTDAEWEALHQKSLVEFERVPKEGQTVKQYAKELDAKALEYGKTQKFDRIIDALLIRAELDTTNLWWQKDAFGAFMDYHVAPSIAEKLCNRIIRLTEAAATSPTDSAVIAMYRQKAFMYANRGVNGRNDVVKTMEQLVAKDEQAGVLTSLYGYDCNYLALTYNRMDDYDNCYKYATKAVDIFEQLPNVPNAEMANIYFTKTIGLATTKHLREAIDLALDKVVPLSINEEGESQAFLSNEVYPFVYGCYQLLSEDNPKDKKLGKEVQQFMTDKLLYAVFKSTDKELNLFGEYLVLERGEWNVETPLLNDSTPTHFVLMKDDEFISLDLKDDQDFDAMPVIKPVDAATKKDIIKRWKAYKKGKK